MNTTLEIISGSKISSPITPKIDAHEKRVLTAIGKYDIQSELIDTFGRTKISLLRLNGFHCFVDKNIENKFKYKAGVNGSYELEEKNKLGILCMSSSLIMVIISIILAIMYLQPLFILSFFVAGVITAVVSPPLNKQSIINYVGDIPEFVLDNMDKAKSIGITDFKIYSCEPLPTEVLKKIDPVMIGWINNSEIGVIIAIWDRDKEITII